MIPINSSTHPPSSEIAIRVDHVSKKFCRYLRKSMRYGMHDIGRNLLRMGTKPDRLRKVDLRRRNAHLYNAYLKDINGITLPVEKELAKNVYWMYSILIEDEFGMTMANLATELEKKGIETRTFFIPMHEQPVFLNMDLFKGESHPVAKELSKKGMYLPSNSGLK